MKRKATQMPTKPVTKRLHLPPSCGKEHEMLLAYTPLNRDLIVLVQDYTTHVDEQWVRYRFRYLLAPTLTRMSFRDTSTSISKYALSILGRHHFAKTIEMEPFLRAFYPDPPRFDRWHWRKMLLNEHINNAGWWVEYWLSEHPSEVPKLADRVNDYLRRYNYVTPICKLMGKVM